MATFRQSRKDLPVPPLESRIGVLLALMAVTLALALARLYYLQVIKHREMAELADRNRIRIRRLPAPRGLVFDRRHRPLVDTVPGFAAEIVPEDTRHPAVTVARLERYIGDDGAARRLGQAERDGRPAFEPVILAESLKWPQVVAIETHQLKLPGVTLRVEPRRHYLYGTVAAHLLGYVGEVNKRELERLSAYHMGDEIGKAGLERRWEAYLRGKAGGQEVEVDALGRRLRMLREIPDQPGASVVLTIDLDLQQAAEQALGDRAGAVVALNPNNGQVLALVSHPAFDPNLFATGITPVQWHALAADPGHPLEDRAIQGTYAPGSTFKLVLAIAGLEEHTLTPSTTYYCSGALWFGNRYYRCWRKQGHGAISLHRAIVQSCDVFFYNVGEHLGVDRIALWAHRLGLGMRSGIALANEQIGIIPSSQWKLRRFHERWYPAETLSVAIGQGYVAVTPIQMAEVVSEIANGGIRYRPQFVKEVDDLDGKPVIRYKPDVESRAGIDPAMLDIVRDAMCDVVNAPGGTGHAAQLPNVTVCGKTGTAQVVKEQQGQRVAENALPMRFRDNGWFVAFAPRDHPRIAIAAVVEHAGHGGSSAGPVVHDVMQKFFELYPGQAAAPVPAPERAADQGQRAATLAVLPASSPNGRN